MNAAVLTYSTYDPAGSAFIHFNLGGNEQSETSGFMLVQVDGGPVQSALCGDIFTGISQNETYDANGTLMTTTPYTRIAYLLANVASLLSGNPPATIQGAALQLAIWDILHDNGDGLGAGNIQASVNTSSVLATAVADFLGAAWTPTQGLIRYELTFQGGNVPAQDVLVLSQVSVPEPGTFAVAGVALAALAMRRKRRQLASRIASGK
jgi:hypothetical protein